MSGAQLAIGGNADGAGQHRRAMAQLKTMCARCLWTIAESHAHRVSRRSPTVTRTSRGSRESSLGDSALALFTRPNGLRRVVHLGRRGEGFGGGDVVLGCRAERADAAGEPEAAH